jgi:hypothetical protein
VNRGTAVAAALGLAWGMTVATAAYAVVRSIQFFVYPDPNPATLVWSAHAGFFWRCWTCGYAGGIAAVIAFLVSQHAPAKSARMFSRAVVVAAILMALQVAFFP